MKILTTISLFALLALVPAAFADHPTATVSMPQGSGLPGCEETNECFVPSEVSVDVGGSVTWTNDDSLLHFVTAGNLKEDPGMVGYDYPNGFESPLMNPGESYTVEDLKEGTYPYFCTVHPWMTGTLYVTASHGDEDGDMETNNSMSDNMMDGEKMMDGDTDAMTGEKTMEDEKMMMDDDRMIMGDEDMVMMESKVPESLDGVMVSIDTVGGDMGSPLQINVEFTDADGNALTHVNYRLTAMQGDETILQDGTDDSPAHSHTGIGEHPTPALPVAAADTPVDVSVYLYGFGVEEITGPSGDVASYKVVPEFGAVAMAVLGVAIVSIVAITAKTRLVPRI